MEHSDFEALFEIPKVDLAKMSLSVLELATVTDVPRRHVDHMLERKIMPEWARVAGKGNRFACQAAFLVAIDWSVSDWLTPKARKSAYETYFSGVDVSKWVAAVSGHSIKTCPSRVETKTVTKYLTSNSVHQECHLYCAPLVAGPLRCMVTDEKTSEVLVRTMQRVWSLLAGQERVTSDPEILAGTPVIKGTRVPVHALAAAADAGTPVAEILESYPSVCEDDVEIASLWAKAHPMVGRPKNRLPKDAAVVRVSRKRAS